LLTPTGFGRAHSHGGRPFSERSLLKTLNSFPKCSPRMWFSDPLSLRRFVTVILTMVQGEIFICLPVRGLQGRMARGDHALPKLSPRPAMPDPFTPCGCTTPETAVRPFQGQPTHKAGDLRPSSTILVTPRHTPMPLLLLRGRGFILICITRS
jgi:hypothetical protein